ncbi:MAG: sigma-70 family RNA polymerase sigma factor [Gemmatimonadales bacterium]
MPLPDVPGASAPTDPTDAALVGRVLAGEREAWAQLVRRHYRAVYVVALAVTGRGADAEDACHDALVRAAERLEECRDPSRFGPWVRTIARNHAKNLMARQGVREGPALETVAPSVEAAAPGQVERRELRGRLEAGLRQLSPAQREVLLRHDLDERPHEEIAKALGTSVGMSRQHLFNARRRLREFLGMAALEEYRDG